MATFYSTRLNDYRLRLELNIVSQNIATNKTTGSYALYIESLAVSFNAQSTGSLVAAGTTVWSIVGQTRSLGMNSELLLTSGSISWEHFSDGTSTAFSGSGTFRTVNQSSDWSVPPLSVSGSIPVPRIPRGPRVHDGSSYKHTVAYVHDSTSHKIAIPYVHDGTGYKIAGG